MLSVLAGKELTESVKNSAPSLASEPAASVLCLEGVRAGYGKKEILKGLALTLNQGEIMTLVGSNGAGKSSILKVVMGLLKPWKGTIRFNDQEIARLPVYQRVRLGLAYLIQGGEVFPSLTVGENLKMGTLVLSPDEKAKAIESALEVFPLLREKFNYRAGLLSGGQRQSLALAMVLAQRPKILLLDEPSAGLAPKLAQEMLEAVSRINEQMGLTILLVEQRVREALEIAHRATVLINGVIVVGTSRPHEWLEAGALDSLFFGRAESVETTVEVTN
ncbi:MAG TPA: ABC transporter ATP-binding protein [Pyrinomonadaceae bacterium]|nr:ABC transporter ATP-binding protein [Pyrinomonadaceae bacterium]